MIDPVFDLGEQKAKGPTDLGNRRPSLDDPDDQRRLALRGHALQIVARRLSHRDHLLGSMSRFSNGATQ